jgi:hypothetical protein
VKDFIGSRKTGFLFESFRTACLCLRAISRGTACIPILKGMGRESAGLSSRFDASVSPSFKGARLALLLIDYWMGHANGEMSGPLRQAVARQRCVAARVCGQGGSWLHACCSRPEQSQIVGRVDWTSRDKFCPCRKWSGRMDLNHRPPGPEPGALARLRYAPTIKLSHQGVYAGMRRPAIRHDWAFLG